MIEVSSQQAQPQAVVFVSATLQCSHHPQLALLHTLPMHKSGQKSAKWALSRKGGLGRLLMIQRLRKYKRGHISCLWWLPLLAPHSQPVE